MSININPETLAILKKQAKIINLSVDEYLHSLLPKIEKDLPLGKGTEETRIASFNFDGVKQTLSEMKGLQVRLWKYLVSHSLLELRVAHCAAGANENRFNTIIVCAGTKQISIGTSSWKSNLKMEIESDREQFKTYRLFDEEAKVLIVCDNVSIEKSMRVKFFSD